MSNSSDTGKTVDTPRVAKAVASITRLLSVSPDLISAFDRSVPVTTEDMAKSTAFFGDSALHRAVSFRAYKSVALLLEVIVLISRATTLQVI